MKEVIVVHKTHLDLGFTDLAENVRKRYLNETDWADDKLINAPVKIIQ